MLCNGGGEFEISAGVDCDSGEYSFVDGKVEGEMAYDSAAVKMQK